MGLLIDTMKKVYWVFILSLLLSMMSWNISLAAPACSLITEVTAGNPFLDEGILDFDSELVDPSLKACIDYSDLSREYFDLKGFVYNTNLGVMSFFSEFNPNTQEFENLGLPMNTNVEYKVSLFPEYNQQANLEKIALRGYGYSNGHGYLKFNCQAHPDLIFDETDCAIPYGVSVALDDYDVLNQTYALQGYAFSENVGFVNFKGARISFDFQNIQFTPEIVDFGPIGDPVSNGLPFYDLALKFFLNGEDKTEFFYDSGYDFCLNFLNQRKLSLVNPDELSQASGCLDHTNLYGSRLNDYSQEAFTYNRAKNEFRLKANMRIASLVPAEGEEFKIEALKTSVLGLEQTFNVNLPLEFKMPLNFEVLPFHIQNSEACDFEDKMKIVNFRENAKQPFSICVNYFRSNLLSQLGVTADFNSNIRDNDLGLSVFKESLNQETGEVVENDLNNWSFANSGFDTDLFFRLNSQFVIPKEISRSFLDFTASYSFQENNLEMFVSRQALALNDNDRSDYSAKVLGIVGARAFNKIDDALTIKSESSDFLNLHRSFVNKLRLRAGRGNVRECTLIEFCSGMLSDFSNVVYLNSSVGDNVNYSDLVRNFAGSLVVLDGLNLLIDVNTPADEDGEGEDEDVDGNTNVIGVVQSGANTYIKTSVTDLDLMLSTDAYVLSYVDANNLGFLMNENFGRYQDSLDETIYNQLYYRGVLRSKNCFGCSIEDPIFLPDGTQALTIADAYKARVLDLNFLRLSPLEFKVQAFGDTGFFQYQDCQEGGLIRGIVELSNLVFDHLCFLDTVNGRALLRSPNLVEDEDEESHLKRSLIFEFKDFDLPFFSQL